MILLHLRPVRHCVNLPLNEGDAPRKVVELSPSPSIGIFPFPFANLPIPVYDGGRLGMIPNHKQRYAVMLDYRCSLPEGSFPIAGKGPCGWEGTIEEMKGNLHWRVLDAGHFDGRCTINVNNSITSTYFQVH